MLSSKKIIRKILEDKKTYHPKTIKISRDIIYKPTKDANLIVYIEDLKKDFVSRSKKHIKQVLKGVNLNIYKGDRIGLIGLNGAGKSTLIEILAGVQEKTSGKVYYAFNYTNEPYEKISIQFQKSRFPSGISAKDVYNFLVKVRRGVVVDPLEKEEMMNVFSIKEIWNSEVNSLSGGQRQRLCIFCALIVKPKIVFLDELTTGLDVIYQKQILSYIDSYVKKHAITLICVSHNLLEIESLANRIVLLKDGLIAADVDPNKIKKSKKSLSAFVKEMVN